MKVYTAITRVMAEIGKVGIIKDRKNAQQGYSFRGIDDVYNSLSPLLASAGLCILPRVLARDVVERATQKGGVLFYVTLDMEFDFVAAEDGSKHTVRVSGEAMDSADKATNKAMSAAYKYACMQVFCIPTEGNPDADSETHEVAPKSRGIDPRGDMGLNVPQSKSKEVVEYMQKLLSTELKDGDHDERLKAKAILDYHESVLNPDPDLYVAVGDILNAAQRNAWKTYVKMGGRFASEDSRRNF